MTMASTSRNHPAPRDKTKYLAVATFSDILFKPLDEYGILALAVIKALIHQHRIEFEQMYGIPPEVKETYDKIYLEGLNPVEWKDQDHYQVLGLGHLRIRATDEDIKKAYRNRCLKHHPDKRQGAGQVINPEGDYFACIVKAQEILGTPKRRSYDSVDPLFNNSTPPKKITSESEFYKVYGNWFAANARWSIDQPVPLLGNEFAPREEVDEFYKFWFNFDSWREYSYLDEEEKEKGQYREERRWIDKQNKFARAKLKKEEMARIRGVVQAAYDLDFRVPRFKEEDKQKKLEVKEARQNLVKQKQLEEQKLVDEMNEKAKLEREKEEAIAKEQELAIKKEKESQKKLLKKERKSLRTICKDFKFFSNNSAEELENMTNIEHLCEILTATDLQALNEKLAKLSFDEAKTAFQEQVSSVTEKIEKEKEANMKAASLRSDGGDRTGGKASESDWSTDELSLLIKAVNLFPAGTNQRWEVIANFLHQHAPDGSNCTKRTAKQILSKAKDMKSSDFSKNSMKKVANEQAFEIFEKSHKPQPVEAEESTRIPDAPVQVNKASKQPEKAENCNGTSTDSKPWTTEEQKLLEQALKTYSAKEPDRWGLVAACVPGRTKKECMIRFKELAALVKAKKAAMDSVRS